MDTPIFPRRRARGNARADRPMSLIARALGNPGACRSLPTRGPFPSTLASLSPIGCRPLRIASTISGAGQVSGRRRQTWASVTPSHSMRAYPQTCGERPADLEHSLNFVAARAVQVSSVSQPFGFVRIRRTRHSWQPLLKYDLGFFPIPYSPRSAGHRAEDRRRPRLRPRGAFRAAAGRRGWPGRGAS
jgi:hypothetical protein